jgi:hypothetical protein
VERYGDFAEFHRFDLALPHTAGGEELNEAQHSAPAMSRSAFEWMKEVSNKLSRVYDKLDAILKGTHMLNATLPTDMPWVRSLSVRLRRSLQIVMLLYLLIFLWPSYHYGLYLYPEDEIPADVYDAVPEVFGFGFFPDIFVALAARFIAVPFSFALVALV